MNDTIVAAATPPGRGGIAVVRLSGPATLQIARAMLDAVPAPRVATSAHFRHADRSAIDHGLACYFPAPHSYTGESVLELHSHGSPVVVEALIRRTLELGARRARPGEFTQRAYLNSKLDLAQAEAVADLINASSEQGARAALRSLEGEFSRRVIDLSDALGKMRVYVEAAIDFAEEEIDVLSSQALSTRLQAARDQLRALQAAGRQGRLLTQGMTLVIAGRPNVGKSTLLNRLAGHEAAIVTATPGTTRDVLREHIVIDGMPLQILDTAGLRQAGDAIEAEGIRRARAAIATADRILFVIDASSDPHARAFQEQRADLPVQVPVTLIFNKLDLAPERAATESYIEPYMVQSAREVPHVVSISALTGQGIEVLRAHLLHSGGLHTGIDALSARARHLEALNRVGTALDEAAGQLARHGTPELVAEELKRAQWSLGEIVGTQSSDELLGQIFSSFCIGK